MGGLPLDLAYSTCNKLPPADVALVAPRLHQHGGDAETQCQRGDRGKKRNPHGDLLLRS